MGKGQQIISEYWQTNFMLFTKKGFSRVMDELQIEGKRIVEVLIDNKLSWKPHIRYICTKVAKGIGVILKARKVFDHETLSTLYYTFVYPYLNYCAHVWGRAYDTHLNDLRVLQNKVVRIINGVPPRTNTDYLYSQQSILSVNRLFIIILGYSCTNTPTVCFLESLIISFRRLKIHTHIALVNPQQDICMWIFEVLREDRDPAYIAVQSSGISYWTTLTLIVLLVHLKDKLNHYS